MQQSFDPQDPEMGLFRNLLLVKVSKMYFPLSHTRLMFCRHQIFNSRAPRPLQSFPLEYERSSKKFTSSQRSRKSGPATRSMLQTSWSAFSDPTIYSYQLAGTEFHCGWRLGITHVRFSLPSYALSLSSAPSWNVIESLQLWRLLQFHCWLLQGHSRALQRPCRTSF